MNPWVNYSRKELIEILKILKILEVLKHRDGMTDLEVARVMNLTDDEFRLAIDEMKETE